MDDDTEAAAYAQQEQDERRQREDALLKTVRKKYGSFRAECDGFHAEFNRSMRSITKGNEHGYSSN